MTHDHIYIVIAVSCTDCNTIGAKILSHEPTEEEKVAVRDDIGGMRCIRVGTIKMSVDGETVEVELD